MYSGGVGCETFVDDGFSLTESAEGFDAFLAGEACESVFDISKLREESKNRYPPCGSVRHGLRPLSCSASPNELIRIVPYGYPCKRARE